MEIVSDDFTLFSFFQTIVQISFILAVIGFTVVASDTAGKVMHLKQDIREGRCIPYEMHTPETDGKVFQGLDMNTSNRSPSEIPSSPAS